MKRNRYGATWGMSRKKGRQMKSEIVDQGEKSHRGENRKLFKIACGKVK